MELFLKEHEHSVKFFAAIAAAIFALTQYYGHLKEQRVKQTLEFQKRYSSEPLYSTRLYVNQKWEENWPNIAEKFQKPKSKPEE